MSERRPLDAGRRGASIGPAASRPPPLTQTQKHQGQRHHQADQKLPRWQHFWRRIGAGRRVGVSIVGLVAAVRVATVVRVVTLHRGHGRRQIETGGQPDFQFGQLLRVSWLDAAKGGEANVFVQHVDLAEADLPQQVELKDQRRAACPLCST